MKIQDIIISALALGLVALGVVVVTGPEQTPQVINQPLGAVNPEFATKYIKVGGLTHEYRFDNTLETATSTLCSFVSPAATSSLAFAGARLNTATGTALSVFIATGRGANSTTTLLAGSQVASGAQYNAAATSTLGTIIGPNQYINFNFAGAVNNDDVFSAGTEISGSCGAEFILLP